MKQTLAARGKFLLINLVHRAFSVVLAC